MSFVMTDEFSVKVHTKELKDWCLMNSQPTFLILTLFLTQLNGHIIKSM